MHLQIVVPIEGFGADGARELHWACEDLIRCWDPVLTPAVHSAQLLHLLLLLLLLLLPLNPTRISLSLSLSPLVFK